jgi:hypothetical protein
MSRAPSAEDKHNGGTDVGLRDLTQNLGVECAGDAPHAADISVW